MLLIVNLRQLSISFYSFVNKYNSCYLNDTLSPANTAGFDFMYIYIIANNNNNKRNSSADDIANVNFLYDDIVHVLQNTID